MYINAWHATKVLESNLMCCNCWLNIETIIELSSKKMFMISNSNTSFIFADWRLWSADMGEISGTERNKGLLVYCWLAFYLRLSLFHFFPFALFSLCSAFSESLLILFSPFCKSSFILLPFTLPPVIFQWFLLTLSFLVVTCPSVLSSPPSSYLQFISLVSMQQGGWSLVSHRARLLIHAVDR